MSFALSSLGQLSYIGTPYSVPIQLSGQNGRCVPLFFDWLTYGGSTQNSNLNVKVSLFGNNVQLLDKVRSVYIDNLQSDDPIFVQCIDTNYTVSAQPNSAGWYSLFTNDYLFNVAVQSLITGHIPQTRIYFSNIVVQSYSDLALNQNVILGRASPTVQRGGNFSNSSYAAFALGDQSNQSGVQLTAQNSANLFNPAILRQPSGFYYLTAIRVDVVRAYNAPAGTTGSIFIGNGDQNETLFEPNFWAPTQANVEAIPGLQNILYITGMQQKLDATLNWAMANLVQLQGGFAQCYVNFTYQP